MFLQFYVCKLHDRELVVVPDIWLFHSEGTVKCRWTSSLEKAKNAAVQNPNWMVYEVKTLWAKRGMD